MPIQKTIDKYLEYKKEYENIKKEIEDYRKNFKSRLKTLQDQMNIYTELISNYLERHNHPAITYNGVTIKLTETKTMKNTKKISRKNKESNLKTIKNNYNLSDECIDDIYESLLGIQETTKKISTKKT